MTSAFLHIATKRYPQQTSEKVFHRADFFVKTGKWPDFFIARQSQNLLAIWSYVFYMMNVLVTVYLKLGGIEQISGSEFCI